MIVKEEKVNVHSSFSGQTNFQIKTTALSFRLLSQNLYSDGWLACTREIAGNAVDSHNENNCSERPIEITLPSALNSIWKCRDFGVSMNEDFMKNQYTLAMHSSKRESNISQGMFGLGRLSAFAVTDSYTIKCFDGKNCRLYACYIGQDGPVLSSPITSPSNEEKGVEVSFHVKREDIHRATEAARKAFEYYPVKPIIKGAKLEFPSREIVLQNNDWKVAKTDYYSSKDLILIMGGVAYKTGKSVIDRCEVLVECPIGSFSVTPSREAIQWDGNTTSYVDSLIKRLDKEIKEEFGKELVNCVNVFEAWNKCNDVGIWGIYEGIDLQNYRFTRPNLQVWEVRGHSKKLGYEAQSISPTRSECHFFNHDEKTGRIRQFVREGNSCFVVKFGTDQDRLDFEKESGLKVRNNDDLPKVVGTGKKAGKPDQYFEFTGYSNYSRSWRKLEKPPTLGCYVELKGCEPVGFGNHDTFISIIATAKKLGFNETIYAVRKASVSNVTLPTIDAKLKELIDKNKHLAEYGCPDDYSNYRHLSAHEKLFPSLKPLITRTKFALENDKTIYAYNSLCRSLKIEQKPLDPKEEFDKVVGDEPLVKFLITYCSHSLDKLDPECLQKYLKSNRN